MAPSSDPRRGRGVTWSLVEDGFHVGSRDGELLGYIVRGRDGRFDAFDPRSRHVGSFTDLAGGMRELAVERPQVLTQVRSGGSR